MAVVICTDQNTALENIAAALQWHRIIYKQAGISRGGEMACRAAAMKFASNYAESRNATDGRGICCLIKITHEMSISVKSSPASSSSAVKRNGRILLVFGSDKYIWYTVLATSHHCAHRHLNDMWRRHITISFIYSTTPLRIIVSISHAFASLLGRWGRFLWKQYFTESCIFLCVNGI